MDAQAEFDRTFKIVLVDEPNERFTIPIGRDIGRAEFLGLANPFGP